MVEPVRLVVPRDARFGDVAPELAGKYCAAAGGADADVAALEAAVGQALRDLAGQPGGADDITLDFTSTGASVDVALRCGSQTSTVTHPLPAGRAR